jgi:membrane fusion protein, multidrug efflux system
MTFDAPESDFELLAPGTVASVHVIATGKVLSAPISRRSPAADPETRTVHVEIDIPDPKRQIPVNTTGQVRIEVGAPVKALEMPLVSGSITGSKAAVFTVDDGVAHQTRLKILGEVGSDLYVEPSIKAGTLVVTEGWATLAEGDHVATRQVPFEGTSSKEAAKNDAEDKKGELP